MLDNKRKTPFIALIGAVALMASAPAFAQDAAAPAAADAAAAPAADAAAAPAADAAAAPAADAAAPGADEAPATIEHAGKLTVMQMFMDADPVVKVVMIGLVLSSILSWTLLVTKLLEFGSLNRTSDRFIEAFRGAKSVTEMNRIAMSDEYEGNPLADMTAAATQEVELSRQAGLAVSGAHRETTLHRAEAAVGAVQALMAKRLSGGMQFLASVGSSGPFIGLFGTVYGIMNSFIGIANTNTTNLAVVAPGIAEALVATAIGLFAAIPAVVAYNRFAHDIDRISIRFESFMEEFSNILQRNLR